MTETYLFVYGSLRLGVTSLPPSSQEFAAGLHRVSRLVGLGWTQGRLYRVADWYPAMVEPGGPEDWVRGDVLAVPDTPQFWTLLDEFEEAGPAPEALRDERFLYRRLILPVRLDDGDSTAAWGYMYNHSVDEMQRIGSGDWLG